MYSSGFFNGDAEYGQEEFNRYFSYLYENGVNINADGSMGLEVSIDEGAVKIAPGFAIINGFYFYNDSEADVGSVSQMDTMRRHARVLLRLDEAGEPGSIEPALEITSPALPNVPMEYPPVESYEISLARIYIAPTGQSISLVDERPLVSVCGAIRPKNVTEYRAMIASFQNDWAQWFETMKGQEVDGLAERVAELKSDSGATLSVSGTTLTLKNKAGAVVSTVTTQDTWRPCIDNAWATDSDKTLSARLVSNLRANTGAKLAVSGTTVQLKNLDGTVLSSITTQDTNTNTWRGIQDNLSSSSTSDSLSANQGRVLNGKFASYLPLSGGTMTGHINMNSQVLYGAAAVSTGQLQAKSSAIYVRPKSGTSGTVHYCYENLTTWTPVGASAFNSHSSRLIKENIEDMDEETAAKVLLLRPVVFDFNEAAGGEKGQYGFIAEEALEVLPKIVTFPPGFSAENFDEKEYEAAFRKSPENVLSIDYSKLTPYLVKFAQMQEERITALENELKEIKERLSKES